MKRIGFFLCVLLLSTMPLSAQTVSPDKIKADILQFSTKVSSIDCDFVQTKESSLLASAAVSKGHMSYRKPGYLQWVYTEPNSLALVADGSSITLTKDGQTTTLSGNQNRLLKEMAQMIIGNIEGSILSDEKMFKAQYEVADGRIVVTLFPQKKDIQKMWSKLVLYYEQKSFNATKFEMYETSGDLTVVSFSNIKYDVSE